MPFSDASEPQRRAALQIAAVLQQLERDSGQLVDAISLRRFDVQTISDVGPRHLMSVEITLVRTPGHDWQTSDVPLGSAALQGRALL